MGGLAEERVRLAVRGLVDRDVAMLDDVLTGDPAINALHIEIDDRCSSCWRCTSRWRRTCGRSSRP